MTQPINTVVRRLPRPLKVMDRSLQKAVSPAAARQIVEGRRIDTSKIYKGGASPTVPPLPHKLSGITPHSVGGDASNTVTGPASIAELARALKNDPQLIYEWVHNNIDWDPGWGLLKGAFGTLVGGRGNSFDQSALMVALLRAAGYTANYVLGAIQVSAAEAGDWFGTVSDNIDMANQYCFYNYIPVDYIWNPVEGAYDITIGHVWVQCVIGATTYVFDPSRKSYNRTAAALNLSNLAAAMGYNSATFLAAARSGATIDPSGNWVQNINQANVDSSLAALSTTLATWMKTNHPGATLNDILGGAEIIPVTLPVLQTSLPYETAGDIPTVWTGDVPISYKTTFEFSWPDANIDQTFTSEQLAGSRLTIWWTTSGTGSTPTLYLNGTAVQIGTEIPTWMFVTYPNYIVTHNAFHDTNANENAWMGIDSGVKHLLATVWGNPGRAEATHHQDLLVANRASGALAAAESVLGESLALLWSTQCAEFTAIQDIMSRLLVVKATTYHGVGVVTYNDVRPGIGIASYLGAQVATDYSNMTDRSAGGVFGMIGSALECAMFQQVVGNIPSVNTGAMIRAENAAGGRIYQGTQANWTSVIEPALWAHGYSSTDTDDIYNNFVNWGGGATVELPQHKDVALGSASGYGFWFWPNGTAQGPGGIVNFTKGGGGGEPQTPTDINEGGADRQVDPDETKGPGESTNEPIDLFSGCYYYSNEDINVGSQKFPFGLAFTRHYNSRNRFKDGPLGLGWTHNLNVSVAVNTDAFLALGQQSALPVAPSLVAFYVLMDLCSGPISTLPLDKHVSATLVSSWWVDQVTDNTVVVQFATGAEVYCKMPDGTYVPPPYSASTLTLSAGVFTYTTPQRIAYHFNTDGTIHNIMYPAGVVVTYNYVSGRLSSVSSSVGRQLTLTYSGSRISSVSDGSRSVGYSIDGSGNLATYTDPNSKITAYSYDEPGRLTNIYLPANPLNSVVINEYDLLDRIKTQTDAMGNVWTYYFASSRSTERDPSNNEKTWYFNNRGSTVLEIDALGNRTSYSYDGLSRLTSIVLPEGNKKLFSYDSSNNILSITAVAKPGAGQSNRVTAFTYDSTWNKVKTATDANNNTTTYNYDATTGSVLSVTSPTLLGGTPQTSYTYNSRGQLLTITDESGMVTKLTYDGVNETLVTVVVDYGGVGHLNLTTSFGYDTIGNLITSTDHRLHQISGVFDLNRRLTQITYPAPFNYVTKLTYDDNDNLTKIENQTGGSPAWQTSTAIYNLADQLQSVTDPTGNSVACEYNNLGLMSKMTNAQGSVWQYQYDELRRPVSVISPTGSSGGSRTYTPNGTLHTISDARGNVTTFTFDGFDATKQITYADFTYEQNTYDDNGNILTFRQKSGNTITYTYDVLNRVKTIAPQGQSTVTYTYDLSGRVTVINKPLISGDPSSGDWKFFFDTAGRLSSEQTPDGKTVQYQLDENSNLLKLTYPDGYFVSRVYDELDRLTDIKLNGSSTSAVHFDYDALSRRKKLTYGNGVVVDYTHLLDDNLASLVQTFTGSSVNFGFGYNQVGQIVNRVVSDQSFVWRPVSTGSTTYGAADSVNKYASVGGNSFSYDGNQNLASDGVFTFGYDTENHLTSVTKPGLNVSFVYNPMHNQIQKTVGSTKTRYVYSGAQIVAEYDGASDLLRNRYVLGPSNDEILLRIDSGGTVTYQHCDHQNSVIAISSSSGSLLSRITYSPFGETSTLSGTAFGYTGQKYDPEIGLYYYKARYYSPNLGRFLQGDPLGYQDGLNLYSYVDNDPINKTDPSGFSKKGPDYTHNDWGHSYGGNGPGDVPPGWGPTDPGTGLPYVDEGGNPLAGPGIYTDSETLLKGGVSTTELIEGEGIPLTGGGGGGSTPLVGGTYKGGGLMSPVKTGGTINRTLNGQPGKYTGPNPMRTGGVYRLYSPGNPAAGYYVGKTSPKKGVSSMRRIQQSMAKRNLSGWVFTPISNNKRQVENVEATWMKKMGGPGSANLPQNAIWPPGTRALMKAGPGFAAGLFQQWWLDQVWEAIWNDPAY